MAPSSSASFHPMDRKQTLYRATLQDAASGGALLMGKLVTAARQSLQVRESAERDVQQRNALAACAKVLREHESVLCQRFPHALAQVFDAPRIQGKKAAVAGMDFDQLELMGEAEVLSSVAIARMRQMAMLATENSLIELDGLIASLQGQGAVQAETNPLRPDSYIEALDQVFQHLPGTPGMRLDWISAMADCLARELDAMYVALCTRLQREGVVPAAYAAAPHAPLTRGSGIGRGVALDAWKPAGVERGDAVPGGAVQGEAAQGGAGQGEVLQGREQTLLTLDKLRRLLSGELGVPLAGNRMETFSAQFAHMFENAAPPADAQSTSFDATVPAALEALTEMRQVDRVVQTLEQRRAQGAVAELPGDGVAAVRAELRARARDTAQVLSLEVVALMVDNMARDERLLRPVQDLVRSIEPALMHLSLADPRFFTDKQHSARRLLQEITQRSMAFESEQVHGFPAFLQEVQRALVPLLRGPVDSAEPFETMLQVLQRSWSRVAKSQEAHRAAAVDVLKHAESRNVLAEKIARGIDAHPDSKRVAPVVIHFLCGPWAQVVAQARLQSGGNAPLADKFQALIPALLWSAHSELARQSPAKLTKLLPRLLATLREGLETIHYPATMTSAFLEALMQVHQQAFRPLDDLDSAAVVAAPSPPPLHWIEQGDPWIAPGEAQSSNFVELADVPEPARPMGDTDFPLGCWVDWKVEDKWVRTQLSWSSPHGTLFLFTNSFGSTQSMTRRTRDRLIASGGLRVVSGQPVLEGALDAVVQTAMRNSVDSAY